MGRAKIATRILSWAPSRAGAPKVPAIPSGDTSVVQVAYPQLCLDMDRQTVPNRCGLAFALAPENRT